MKNKILLSLVLLLLGVLTIGAVSVSAARGGDLTYIIVNDEVTITDCNTSATGEMVIPDTIDGYPVTNIEYSAFSGCTGLVSVDIPDSVTSIVEGAFYGCTGLKKVNITSIEAWCNISFSGSYSNPLCYAGNLYLNGELVTELVIPDSVTSIDNSTFRGCTGLVSLDIPDSVTSIGSYAFCDCTGLVSVDIPDSVTSIGEWAFSGCTGLVGVDIPDSVTSIGEGAFYGCTGLVSVDIPGSVTSIGDYTFYGCTGLVSVTIPDSVTSIGDYAFWGCTGLVSVDIPDSVTSIGEGAFCDCTGLVSVDIPDSVTSIEDYAFYRCTGLVSVNIPDSVTSIGERAFYRCSSLEKINISSIEAWCNISFDSASSNPLSDSIYDEVNLYLNGELVTDLVIPDSVTTISDYAFYNCYSLTSVTIGSGVKLIPESAFYDCDNLKYVCLPDELLYIRNDAFNYCPNIQTVFYEGSESQWNKIWFYNRNENLTDAKVIYNATKKTYSFETNCDVTLPSLTAPAIFTVPVCKNGEKTLEGWYDNASFSGEAVSFPYYGSATTLYASWTDRTGTSFDDAFIAKENKEYTVNTTQSGQIIYYEFVPMFTGEYRFYSTGNHDTYGYLYDSYQDQISSDDDDGAGNNFYIARELTAGETYYIGAKVYNGKGSFTLVVETDCIPGTKTVCVTAATGKKIFISIPSYLPQDARIILACYRNGNLVETQIAPNKNETIYFVADNEFDTAKIMSWESIGNLKPLCKAEVVQ